MSQKLITLEEAADMLGMTPAELSILRERGEVRAFRDGASWKFKQDDVERVATQRRANSAEPPAGSDSDELLDLPLDMDDDSDDVVLLSEVELGESDPSTSSTIIGKPGSGQAPDESDIKLSTKADSSATAPPSAPPQVADEPEIQLTTPTAASAEEDDLLVVDSDDESDFDLSLGDDDEVSLMADVSSTEEEESPLLGLDLDSDDDFALADDASSALDEVNLGEEDDDDEMVLRSGPGSGSDITVGSADSGISLLDPSDSGLSLDQPLDLGEDSEEMMGLDADDDQFDLSEDSEAGSLASDEDFMLTPMEDAESQESGSQVIALDDSGDEDDFGAGGMFEEESSGEEMVSMVEEEDALGGGFDDDLGSDDLGGGELAGAGISGGAALAPAARGTEANFSGLQILSLGFCAILLVICGMFMIDLMRNMWSWEGTFSANSTIMDSILSLFEG